jgi:hypothetical protein
MTANSVAMMRELESLVSSIRESLDGSQTQPTPLDDGAPSREELDRLEHLLESADYRSVSEFRQLEASLRRQHGAPAAEIGNCLRNFDYVRALTLLRALRVEESR